ncbi:serine/threonine-protein kinase [Actinophytocola gossypii]|uniref:non-specific serine/threonine protein kinase n=1 Tax=Actinophytocola gossypii TaxID=2812003 RepID=A0ABT2JBF9_9PSEU|nr:serine/threonine-protein kinase [Actinophytocola gossypii]MCT2585185.1 protein kinase [Actinophytocola gossypii]
MTQEPVPATAHLSTDRREVAGRYALLEEIGRGGMGIVWLAEDRMIGRRVAVKELQLPAGVPPDERRILEERVLREARTAGRLNDPAVVTVYDVVQESGTTFIVMELIEAPTLSSLVYRQGPLPQDAVARLAEQLLSALESAHAAGIVHRDVKPSNIMVHPNGRVKLTDFGIAQAADDPRLTSSGVLVGSPSFLPPERIQGAEADPASDLWALAAVLFFAVEGHSPFERSSTAATMNAILNEVPYLTRTHGPLASVIMGLLNTVPSARPSAEQVRGLLAQVTNTPAGGITTALTSQIVAPTTAVARPDRRRRRGPVLALVAVLGVAVFAGGFLTSEALGSASADERPPGMADTVTFGEGGTLPEFTYNDYYPEGGCLNGRVEPGQRIGENAQVECTEPHDLQVYANAWTMDIPEENDEFPDVGYPDPAVLNAYAERYCTMAFDSELVAGDAADKENLRYRALVPSERAWEEWRGVYCVLGAADGGQLTESYLASK